MQAEARNQTDQAGRNAPGATSKPAWHALPHAKVLTELGSRETGLSDTEVTALRQRYGENALSISPPTAWWKILARQFRSLMVLLLTIASAGALVAGDHLEAIAIAIVLVLNTGLGFSMEIWARQEMESIRRLEVQSATVRRQGRVRQIDARELVPGDVILIEAGKAIPADARILSCTELRVVEAPLTGESVPTRKRFQAEDSDVPTALPDRRSMLYKGTLAAAGSGEAVVVATGGSTEIGHISELVLEATSHRSPLEKRLDTLGGRLVWIALAIAAVVAGLGMLRSDDWWLMAETGIALAIAAVPEGLPVVATITLALGMRRMARRHALVRRLSSVETLGSATLICADKTGTMTAGEMTVVTCCAGGREIEVTGTGYEPEGRFQCDGTHLAPLEEPDLVLALSIGMLTNRATVERTPHALKIFGDPTEAALLIAGEKAGIDRVDLLARQPELEHVPFSSERMLMATFHGTSTGERVAYVKGAPTRLLEVSDYHLYRGRAEVLDDSARQRLLETNRSLASRGLRVLALAHRSLSPGEALDESSLTRLTFVGLVGIIDPPAPDVADTVRRLKEAGVRTVMITGDQAITAEAVARQLGLLDSGGEVLEARTLRGNEELAFEQQLDHVEVFSRVSPADKLQIVQAFQKRGEIVAMLGDGVNDAPALKQADIGVAMGGRGTDVAKETADLVLRDDRFETISIAVEEGRVIFDNIRKFIFYLFSCNLAEILVLFVAGLVALPMPLLPLQILWLNLITDVFPALALAAEPPEPGVMRRPPRDPQAAILSRGFLRATGIYGALLTTATLFVFLWALKVWSVEPQRATTIAFMTLALAQLLHVFNARSEKAVLFSRRILSNGWVWGAIGLTIGLQLAAVYEPGLSRVLHTSRLGIEDWILVLTGSAAPLLAGQVWKLLGSRS
jgi:Ca2+-transporting ATPase